MNYKELKKQLLKSPVVKKEYERADLAFEIARMLIRLRVFKGITQEKLAKMLGTKQPSIARAESGNHLPSISFLDNVAKVTGTCLLPPKFACLEGTEDEDISLNLGNKDHWLYPKSVGDPASGRVFAFSYVAAQSGKYSVAGYD